ncbi:MAG: PspC domain-containing protein [Bacilli bacterium]|nr:PspC domain-containing protein [Bacilli bacterium]
MDNTKRLCRVNEGKAIFGVCSGIAEYTNTDVGLIRIITLVLVLFGGFPILIYFILAIALPIKEDEIRKAEVVEDEYAYNKDDFKY